MSTAPRAQAGFSYIERSSDLRALCAQLAGVPWLAVDTEFIREKSFYPRLCLIQVGVPDRVACIDPLSIDDLEPLLDLLYDRSILKVLHACAQDLEIFAHLNNAVPAPIFDTQLAAPLLGLPEQMGYAAFVKEMRGVSLDKGQTRTDWTRRPLGEAQLRYAGDDVRYLADIYPEMRAKLEALGRLAWLRSEFEPYERLERYRADPALAWQRIRGAERLSSRALSILQVLARWREETAQEKDLPRNWVLKDDALIDMARLAPADDEALSQLRSLPAKTRARHGEALLRLIKEGSQREPDTGATWKRRHKPTVGEEALADVLQAQLRLLADTAQINSAVIAGRKDLLALAQGAQDLPVLRGWRRAMAGNELLAMCEGQRSIAVEGGQVRISNRNSTE